jgi:hypothetical protein
MLTEQSKLGDDEHPKLLTSDLDEKADALKREISYLVNKAKYFKPKTTTQKSTTSMPKTGTKNTSSTADEYEEEVDDGEDFEEKTDRKTEEPEKKEDTEKSKLSFIRGHLQQYKFKNSVLLHFRCE